ncbi:MAG: type III secretion system export apparatus subunit SctV [Acidobacteriota bacterium]
MSLSIKLPPLDPRSLRGYLLEGNLNQVLTRYSDIFLALLVIAIVGILVVPMPAPVLDLFLAANITLAVVMLMISLYIPNAMALASFPSILLVATLFRLALNVSSTRLILLQGYAGEVIGAFGTFVVRGDYVVGFVVFLIITIIQFVVIAKGAERVSEVSARFTLDALPGKQMSIDADLRAGIIDIEEARRRRELLGRESQFYGAMDGAMKFVKGDAIAGILISLINIAAGLGIGILARDMTFAEAAKRFTLLTVGDGLVSQIPSLLIATAAGIITTRVASAPGEESSLGREIGVQILAQPRAIAISSGLLFVLALVPGLPVLPFLVLSLAAAGLAWGISRTRDKKDIEARRAEVMGSKEQDSEAAEKRLPMAVPVILETSTQITPLVDIEADGARFISELIPQMREWLFSDLGVIFPGVRVRGDADNLTENGYGVYVNEVPVANGVVHPDKVFVSGQLDQVAMLGIDGVHGPHPAGQGKGLWVSLADAERIPAGVGVRIQPDEYMALHLAQVLRKHVDELIGIQEVQNMLDLLEGQGYGALAQSVVPNLVSVQRLTDVLRRLLRENISIRNMRAILEALAEWASFESDPVYLTEYVRMNLKQYIAHRYAAGRSMMSVYLLDPRIEQAVRDGVQQSSSGSSLSLEPEVSRALLDAFGEAFGKSRGGSGNGGGSGQVVALTHMEVRYFIKRLLEFQYPHVAVLSFQELPPSLQIQPVGRVTLPEGSLLAAEEARLEA